MQDELLQMALRMLKQRRDYFKRRGNLEAMTNYESAAQILEYAMDGNFDCLSQFDYFGEMG